MQRLNSSAIAAVDYNARTSTMSIWFVESGGPYDYYMVPETVYRGILTARSAGSYFNTYIRDRYSSNR
ncbi:KTSC domain-containing protein [Agrobacterium rosae]|uniref:KTSC domain-containing protein n=1 Tax=Agrobacterium rosae TaxID=1972867 RepID=UPI0019D406F2|nr:KTSC domain-containing protein [Agrobacterium rosae]